VERDRALVDEVSVALTLSGTAASMRLGLAIALDRVVPRTWEALSQGRVDAGKAKAVCDGVVGVGDAVARRVEELVLPEAPGLTARQVAARVRRAVVEADPEAFAERRGAVEARRRVELFDNPDGTADLSGRDLPADEAEAAYNYVAAVAAGIKADGDERPMEAIRADVLLRLLRGHSPAEVGSGGADRPDADRVDADRPDAQRPDVQRSDADRPDVQRSDVRPDPEGPAGPPGTKEDRSRDGAVAGGRGRRSGAAGAKGAGSAAIGGTGIGAAGRAEAAAVGLAIRKELAEFLAGAGAGAGGGGGGGDGRGPVEMRVLVAEAARRIRDALAELKIRWCEIAMDQGGQVAHGHDGYRPPARMRRLVQARNRTCGFPTCRRPAEACDLDHTLPYHRGGPTCPCNLAPLCRRHHRLKQSPNWTLIQPWPGVLVWITPTGHHHLTGPDP
jgi:hypothetical protein